MDLVKKGGFVEYTTSYNTLYGTSLAAILAASPPDGSSTCLLDIDTQGVINIKTHHPHLNPLYVFIAPPSLEALGERLRKRGTENEEKIVKRLGKARSELEYAASGAFDLMIVNDSIDRAYNILRDALVEGKIQGGGDQLPEGILEETAVSMG